MFYNDISVALKAGVEGLPGGISIADSALLREMSNLKQARQIMAIRQQIYERKMQEQKIADNEMAMKANQVAAQSKTQGDMMVINAQKEADLELAILNGKIQEKLQNDKYTMEAEINGVSDMVKQKISKQQSIDEIVKQALRNKVEFAKVEKRPDKSPKD
jgi:hypothetical protein